MEKEGCENQNKDEKTKKATSTLSMQMKRNLSKVKKAKSSPCFGFIPNRELSNEEGKKHL